MLEFYPTGWCVLLKAVIKGESKIIVAGKDGTDVRAEYVVVRVGEKVTSLKEGDICCAGGKTPVRVKFRGSEFFIEDERNIWCVVRDNPKARKSVEGVTVQEEDQFPTMGNLNLN